MSAFAVLAAMSSATWAAPVRLEEVVQGALNGGTAVAHENERVNRAAGQAQQAQGAFDWNASLEIGPERLYVAKADSAGRLTNDLETVDTWHTTLGVSRQFRNGVSVAPGVSFYANSGASAAQTQGVTKPRPALNLTIPLAQGFGENSAAAANERAALATLEGTRAGRSFVAQRNVHDAVQTYWRCLAARQHREIFESVKRSSDDDVNVLRDQVQRGQAEPTVLNRALARQTVNQVELTQLSAAEDLCRRDLGVFLGLAPDGSLPTAEGDFPAMEGGGEAAQRINERALTEHALSTRQDLEALGQYRAAEGERVKAAQDGTQPKIDLYVDTTRILLRLSKPLGNDIALGRQVEAAASESDARLNFEQMQATIRQEIADQVRILRESLANWTALNQSAGLLEGVASDASRRLQAGVITNQDYRTIQDELAQVRNQVIDARLQYASGLAGLRLAMGAIDTEGASPALIATGFRSLP